jgi:hypothetical protein
MGVWFDSLNPDYQRHAQHTFPLVLANNLLGTKANLTSQSALANILTHEENGYGILYQLALLGGHPLLTSHPIALPFPKQLDTIPLPKYITQWHHFLYHATLNGLHYSDRYFLQEFIAGLHSSLHLVGTHLTQELLPFKQPPLLHDAVPSSFFPGNLMRYIASFAVGTACLPSLELAPHNFYRPRAAASSSQPSTGYRPRAGHTPETRSSRSAIRELQVSDDSAPLSADEVLSFTIHAVHQNPTGCFWCKSQDHRLQECSNAKEALNNSRCRTIIRHILNDYNGASQAPSKPAIRQLTDIPEAGEGISSNVPPDDGYDDHSPDQASHQDF